jgi:hypothetical protein
MNVRRRYSIQKIHDRLTSNIALNCFAPAMMSPSSSLNWVNRFVATCTSWGPSHNPQSAGQLCLILLSTETQRFLLSPSFYEMIMRYSGRDPLYGCWRPYYACHIYRLILYCISSCVRMEEHISPNLLTLDPDHPRRFLSLCGIFSFSPFFAPLIISPLSHRSRMGGLFKIMLNYGFTSCSGCFFAIWSCECLVLSITCHAAWFPFSPWFCFTSPDLLSTVYLSYPPLLLCTSLSILEEHRMPHVLLSNIFCGWVFPPRLLDERFSFKLWHFTHL